MLDKFKWYRHRLGAMDSREVAGRIIEKARQITEDNSLAELAGASVGCGTRDFPVLPERSEIPADIGTAICEDALRILQGEWHVLHGQQWSVENPPVWHRDYLAGMDAPTALPARKLNHRNLPSGMDVRLIWELSRWIQVVRLAQAAWLGEDCATAAITILEDWVEKNPVGQGWNWTSPMEPGIRLINFTWIHALLSAVPSVDQPRLQRLADSIVPGHAWWVWRYHSIGSSANNHLLGELSGLLMALARWPDAQRWTSAPGKIALKQQTAFVAQFADDGGNREEALHYHLFAWEMGWQSCAAIHALGLSSSVPMTESLARAARCFVDLAATKEPWDFGDSDDAHITPFYVSESNAVNEWHSWMTGKSSALRYWLGEPPLLPESKPNGRWTVYGRSGYSVLRHQGWFARFDASALGFGSMAAHGHLDALHCSLWLDDEAVLIDPGTGGYFASPQERAILTSRQAHNGPHWPDDALYPRRGGAFLWIKPHAPPTTAVLDDAASACLEIGGRKLIRSVAPMPKGWGITDDSLEASVFHVNWQLAPGWTLKATKPLNYLATRGTKRVLFVLSGEIEGEPRIEEALCSPSFRVLTRSPRIAVRARKLVTLALVA